MLLMRLSLLTFISVLLAGCAAPPHPQATAPALQPAISSSPNIQWPPRGDDPYPWAKGEDAYEILQERYVKASEKALGADADVSAVRSVIVKHMKQEENTVREIRWLSPTLVMAFAHSRYASYWYIVEKRKDTWQVLTYYMEGVSWSLNRCSQREAAGGFVLQFSRGWSFSVRLIVRAFIVALCVLWLGGCASRDRIAQMSDHDYQELVAAGNDFALKSYPVPEAIQRLRPVQVYYYRANVIIALHRDAHEERGYYIVPIVSSYDPRFGEDPEWTLKPLEISNVYSGNIYEYWRKK
jgi:outer membrane murein-binding lipoprotein Lpp